MGTVHFSQIAVLQGGEQRFFKNGVFVLEWCVFRTSQQQWIKHPDLNMPKGPWALGPSTHITLPKKNKLPDLNMPKGPWALGPSTHNQKDNNNKHPDLNSPT